MPDLQQNLVSWVTFLPLLTGVGLLVTHALMRSFGTGGLPVRAWKGVALGSSLFTFLLSLLIWAVYDPTEPGYQLIEYARWLPAFGVHYFVGIDGISLLLVVLTTFLVPIVLLGSWNDIDTSVPSWVFFVLFLETGLLGAFVSLNLFQFYLFWELMLIPMYFIIGIWGGERRVYAAIKFFLFTMFGSLLMLVAMLVLYYLSFEQSGGVLSFDFVAAPGAVGPALIDTVVPVGGGAVWWQTQTWLFAAFALAFAIKVPLFPFHTWLPDAHVEAPTGGSVILAGVLLKMGTYGFVRFALPLFPVAAVEFAPAIFALGLIGVIYGALVAMVQEDVKKLVAYSSVAHLGFVMLGIAAMTPTAVVGAVYQMLNHGISTGALFLLVGMLYERRHTREIAAFGGLESVMPRFAAVFLLICLSSIAVPGFNGFVGEFLILVGSWPFSPTLTALATLGVVLAAGYVLWMVQRVLYGEVTREENRELPDLDLREMAILVPLVVLTLVMGLASPLFTRHIEPSVTSLVLGTRTRAQNQRSAAAPPPPASAPAQVPR